MKKYILSIEPAALNYKSVVGPLSELAVEIACFNGGGVRKAKPKSTLEDWLTKEARKHEWTLDIKEEDGITTIVRRFPDGELLALATMHICML